MNIFLPVNNNMKHVTKHYEAILHPNMIQILTCNFMAYLPRILHEIPNERV